MTEAATKKSPNEENNLILTNSLITRKELDKFKEIARTDYGAELTDEQAFKQATALLNLFDYLINRRLESRKKYVNVGNG
jgi:hypothetical protein